MKVMRIIPVLLLVTLFIAAPLAAECSIGLGVHGSMVKLLGGATDRSAVGYVSGIDFQYFFSERWNAEISLGLGWVRSRDPDSYFKPKGGNRTYLYPYSLLLRYHPAPKWKPNPYLGLGAGITVWDLRDVSTGDDWFPIPHSGTSVHGSRTHFTWLGAAGALIPLSKRCALDVGLRYTRLIDQSLNNIDPRGDDANTGIGEIRLGLLIRFGKYKEAKAIRKEVAEVPVVVAVPEEPPEPVKPVKEEEPVVEEEPVIEEEPAEAAPEPDILLGVDQRIILPAVQFATARAELSPEAKDALKSVAAALKNKPEMNLEIRGYTDSIGSAASNLTLSQRRADTVKKFLVDQGIAFHRLTAVGYGEADPITSNQTAEGRARNRRIELWPIQ